MAAVCVDPPAKSRDVARKNGIAFPILHDPDAKVIRSFGLLHAGGGMSGEDIAIPAQFLFDARGNIVWQFTSTRAKERADPAVILEQVGKL